MSELLWKTTSVSERITERGAYAEGSIAGCGTIAGLRHQKTMARAVLCPSRIALGYFGLVCAAGRMPEFLS